MYIYENHLGSLYVSDIQLNVNDLYCAQCGDYDCEIGNFNSAHEVLKYMANDIDANDGYGGWGIEHVLEVLTVFDDIPTLEKAIEIVKQNRVESDYDDID